MTDPPLDLLGPKRAELGLPPVQSPGRPAGGLLLKGAVVASVILVLSGVAVWLLGSREQQLIESKMQLTPVAHQADRIARKVKSVRSQSTSLQKTIESMTSRLVAIRSGSAFFEQLKRVTPSSVQLRSVSVGSSQIQMEGVVQQQRSTVGPLEQINAFVLNLEGLAGVPDEGVVLQQLSRSEEGVVQFDLQVTVDSSHRATAEELSELGAQGLARRHQWLRDQGLPL